MPVYVYVCEKCGRVCEHVYTIASRPRHVTCDCGGRAERSIAAEHTPRKPEQRLPQWPIESNAAGIHPKQIAETVAKFPNQEFNPRTGAMVFRSHAHRRQCLRQIGMVDRDGYD